MSRTIASLRSMYVECYYIGQVPHHTGFTQDRQPATVVWVRVVYFLGTGSNDAAHNQIIKEMGMSSRHTTVSAEAGRGVISYGGMETITLAELVGDMLTSPCVGDMLTSPYTALLELWKLQTKIRKQNNGTCMS